MANNLKARPFLDEAVVLPVGTGYDTTWRDIVIAGLASLALILAAFGDTAGLPNAELGGLYIFIPFYVGITYRNRIFVPVTVVAVACYLATQIGNMASSSFDRASILAAGINILVQSTAAGAMVAMLQALQDLFGTALTDHLTKLKNRRGLFEAAPRFLASARTRRVSIVAIIVDINQFKLVNDTFGHDAGDRVLCAVGAALSKLRHKPSLAVRTGGDEFLFLGLVRNEHEAQALKSHIRACVHKELERIDIPATASVGMALVREVPDDLDALLADADNQMYRAKSQARAVVNVSHELTTNS
ncbi:MAG: GGDEF domain-containing protein [Chthonomonas sp.]|nr:GGDEF domain-containing protein [Chthonomonas sp.]